MVTAATEVYKSTTYPQAIYYLHEDLFELAQFFSASAHFNIIDSWTPHYDSNKDGSPSYTSYRWKGDPIADDDDGSKTVPPGSGQAGHKVWESNADLGVIYECDNAWLVIEAQTQHPDLVSVYGYGTLPKWQAKFQSAGNNNSFADVSDPTGVKYPKQHSGNRKTCVRWGLYGGWDKADSLPDFNPVGGPSVASSGNHKLYGGNSSGYDARWVLICANGSFFMLGRYNVNSYNFYRLPVMGGDVFPVSKLHMPNPRFGYASVDGGIEGESASNILLTTASTNTNADYSTTDNPGGGIVFWDKDENLLETRYALDAKAQFYYMVSNPFAPTPEIDVFPVYPFPLQMTPVPRNVFTLPYLRRSKNPGTMLLNNKQWLAIGADWGPILPWDGSSEIW